MSSEPPRVLLRVGDLVAVSKPSGLLSQPDASREPSLVEWARHEFGQAHIGVLHRLDRNVSGIVLLALDSETGARVTRSFVSGAVKKTYLAVVRGRSATPHGTIDAPLIKDSRTNEVRVATSGEPGAQQAHSRFRVQEELASPLGRLSVVEVEPITGRSHQLRVHLAHIGLPIVGDPKYGVVARGLHRPLLHASRLELPNPRDPREPLTIVDPAPFTRALLTSLRRATPR